MSTPPPAPPTLPTQPVVDPQPGQPTGTTGTVSMALGIAGLVMACIPFYGTMFAVPLAIAALVLAIVARSRPNEVRRHTTVGLVTASLSLLVLALWVVAFTGLFGVFGWGSSGSGNETWVEEAGPYPYEAGGDFTTGSGTSGVDVRDGMQGAATLQVGELTARLDLATCTFATADFDGNIIRGEATDGSFAMSHSSGVTVVELTTDGPLAGTYVGSLWSVARSSGGGLFLDGESFEGAGTLRRLEDDTDVALEISVDCG